MKSSLAILTALTLACDGTLGPVDVTGTYVLRQVAGDPLPTVLFDYDAFVVLVISDTIRLAPDGTGTISGVREVIPLEEGLPGEGPVHRTSNVRFKVIGDQLEIEYVCPGPMPCVPPPQVIARRVPGGLNAEFGPRPIGRSPLIYTEIQAAP
jgi:hypothetical protein